MGGYKKSTIIGFVVVLIIFGLLGFGIWLCFSKIEKRSSEFFAQKIKINTLEGQAMEVENFKANHGPDFFELEKISQAFVDPEDPLNFIKFLENSAGAENIELKLSPLSFLKDGSINILSAQMSLQGGLSGILNFVNRIENGQYMVSVQTIAVSDSQASLSIKILTQ